MPKGDTVTLAYIHDLEVSYSFHQSLVNLLLFDGGHEARIMRGGFVAMRCARSADLGEARNGAVAGFLAQDAGEWLWFVDTDMGFDPDSVERLLATADPVERPVVGGLCFAQRETEPDGMNGYRTSPRVTILDWVEQDDGPPRFMGRSSYPRDTVVKCAGTGAAMILIHRTVLEKVAAEFGPTWFSKIPGSDGKLLGEDIAFCVRLGAIGIPVHVDTSVKTTHQKTVFVSEVDYEAAFPESVT